MATATPLPALFPPAPTVQLYISLGSRTTLHSGATTSQVGHFVQLSNLATMSVSRVSLCIVIGLLYLQCCYTATIPRNFDSRLSEEMIMTPKKRPFCNAFTGCGRKRSQQAPGMPSQDLLRQKQYVDEETFGSILDSETAIEELSRQILSEAKLWEAIQEASAEIARRKQKESY